jgi:hypothetical protein
MPIRRRYILAVGIFMLCITVVGVLELAGPYLLVRLSENWLAEMEPSDPFYDCEHTISPAAQIRVSYKAYAQYGYDPNVPYGEALHYFIVQVPYFDYEISHDNGATWTRFWRYPGRERKVQPNCQGFFRTDANNFGIANEHGHAITRDGGLTWSIETRRLEDNWLWYEYATYGSE